MSLYERGMAGRWMVWTLLMLLAAAGLAQDAPVQAPKDFHPVTSVGVAFEHGALSLRVPPGAHLKTAFLKVALTSGHGVVSMGKPPRPSGKDELGDPIWRGLVRVPLVGEGLADPVDLDVTYQPCTEGEGGVCYPPTHQVLRVPAAHIPLLKREKGKLPPASTKPPELVPAPAPAPPRPSPPPAHGALWGLLVAFAAGLAASLTPCVFPMIPITMVIIGAKGKGKLNGFILSLALVLGMAVTYTLLGVAAAKTGAVFGTFAQKPAFLVPVAILFGLFALSLFGAFEIRLPMALQNRMQGDGSRRGMGGAFLMGVVLGPISAPCVGPVIGTVLLNIALKGDVAAGASQLFVFALGMGVLFMAVGTFSAGLPKSGDWLVWLKHYMGLVVLGFAAWTLRYLVPTWANLAMTSLLLLIAAAVHRAFSPAEGLLPSLRRGLGLLALVLGILFAVRAVEKGFAQSLLARGDVAVAPAKASLWMEQDFEGALARAKSEGKLLLVDVYAEWCAQCHELDERTWPDPAVQAWIRDHAVALRVDTDKVRPDLAARLGIRSYPTVLLLDGEGKEQRRRLGFELPPKMLGFLEGQ